MSEKSEGTYTPAGRAEPPTPLPHPSPTGERAPGGNSTRALLVAAVSTADKQQDPENQLLPLRRNATQRGYEVADELVFRQSRFDDQSAAEVEAAIIARLSKGDIDVLMVWALDRVTRRGVEAAFRFLRVLETHHQVRFFSLQEPILSTDSPSAEQREVILALIAWAAKWDSGRKSDRQVAKATQKRDSSGRLGQRAVWGKGRMATPAEVATILARRDEGIRPLARELGLSKSQVERILKGEVRSA